MSPDLLQKYAALRSKYPDDLQQIEQEEKRVLATLKAREFASLDTTQEMLEMCRKEVLFARKRLATDRSLLEDPDAQRELWSLIDGRLWFIQMVARDFDAELAIIEMGVDAELERA